LQILLQLVRTKTFVGVVDADAFNILQQIQKYDERKHALKSCNVRILFTCKHPNFWQLIQNQCPK
jgi:hypothetical protein